MNAIELSGVTAGYDGVRGVHAVNLVVAAGQVVALLGANGAGKTTTVRAISGLIAVEQGSVKLLGADVTHASLRKRALHGLATVPDERGLFTQLTVSENLHVGTRRGRSQWELGSWFPELVPLLDRRAGLLSGGEQTMLALARAMVCRPRALVVDELTTGLAPVYAASAFAVLRRAASDWGVGVLVAEQSAHLAVEAADRVCLLRGGQIVLDATPAEVARLPNVLEATYLGEPG